MTRLILIAGFVILSASAVAQEIHHHVGVSPAVDEFYSTWQQPSDPKASCCNKLDCYATAARMQNGHWQAQQRETGNWIAVPPGAVEHNRDGPDPQAHVCMQSAVKDPTVFCFIAAGGT